jgi:hypothetical protein
MYKYFCSKLRVPTLLHLWLYANRAENPQGPDMLNKPCLC